MDPSWQPALSAAQRRKQRRLRSWWRHEQQTVAAVLATFQHHSAPRGPRTARTGGRARVEVHGRVQEDALPQAAGAVYFEMDTGEDDGSAPAAARPAPLLEVLPQERVQQRTAEQIVDPVPVVPLLHDAAPQMVEQLVDFLTPLDFPVPEQVIDVPKIVCPPRAARTVLGVPQTVEQLVEAPTIVSLIDVIRQPVEQPVDIPVRAWWTSSRFSPWAVFLLVCGADRRHSSSSSWYFWRFSRFSPRTEFSSEFGAAR